MPSTDLLLTPLALVVALLVWGPLPGLAIRLIVRSYPKGHDRRNELIAESYVVDTWKRPFWVASQLELGLIEGVKLRRIARKLAKQQNLGPTEAGIIMRESMLQAGSPVVISIPESMATTSTIAQLNDLLIRHSGSRDVLLKLVKGPSARVFEIPYPVVASPEFQREIGALFGPDSLKLTSN